MCNFGFREKAASNVENYPTFLRTLQLPSSGKMCSGWEFWKPYTGKVVGATYNHP
jgi:hypothetical protein